MLGKYIDLYIEFCTNRALINRAPTPSEKEMIDSIALGNEEAYFSLLSQSESKETTIIIALTACVFYGQSKIFEKILGSASCSKLSALLKIAARDGHCDIVNLILSSKQYEEDKFVLNEALRLAAKNGHVNVVICIIKEHRFDPNNRITGYGFVKYATFQGTQPYFAQQRCDALYEAALEGHIEVVLSLLDDPRTSYFDLENMVFNSPDEKAFIITLATLSDALLSKKAEPDFKRKTLFETVRTLQNRSQVNDLVRLFKMIEPGIKKQLFSALLIESIDQLSDGSLKFTFDKSDLAFSWYSIQMTVFNQNFPDLSYESNDEGSITFTPKSSIFLKEVYCIHYNASYLENLVNIQNGMRLFYNSYKQLMQNPIWIQLPKDLWRYLANLYMRVLINLSISDIDPTDKPFTFSTNYLDSSPSHTPLPSNEDVPETTIEVLISEPETQPLQSLPKTKAPINRTELFKVIYKALYKGQSSFFKQWNSDLMDKTLKNEQVITDYIAQNPNSRSAIAWNLTKKFVGCRLDKKELFKEIHKEAYKNSSNLGIFKQSVFENDFKNLDQRIRKAKSGELEGTRTQDIVDALDSHPALGL